MGAPSGIIPKDEPFETWSRWQAKEMASARQEAPESSTQGRIWIIQRRPCICALLLKYYYSRLSHNA